MTVRELAAMANFGGDVQYGRKTKEDKIKAENMLSSLTDKAQSKAEGNKGMQNTIDAAKFLSNFIPGVGPAISAAISAADLVGDTSRASNMEFNLTPEQEKRIAGSRYEDMILQNVNALDSQVKGAAKGQRDASILSNLLNIGLSLGGLPGVDTAAKGSVDAVAKGGVDEIAKETAKTAIKESIPAPTGVVAENWFPMPDFKGFNPSLIKDATKRSATSSVDTATKTAMKDNNLVKFLTGEGKPGTSFIDKVKGEDWFQALSETVPGMDTALGLAEKEIGKTGVNYGSLYGPGSSILTRLMTQYGNATSPAMPGYQRKSLQRRIA